MCRCAIARSASGPTSACVAVGRDLRALAALQQRLAEAQQAMEREYARIRNAEKRYRLLFQLSAEPVLIVDAGNQRVLEANPAAVALFGLEAQALAGQRISPTCSTRPAGRRRSPSSPRRASRRGSTTCSSNSPTATAARAALGLAVSPGRRGASDRAARPRSRPARRHRNEQEPSVLRLIERMPEAFVVADAEPPHPQRQRRVSRSRRRSAAEAQVRGEPIERWLGRPGVDIDVLFANLQDAWRRCAISRPSCAASSALNEDVEIAGVAAPDGGEALLRPHDPRHRLARRPRAARRSRIAAHGRAVHRSRRPRAAEEPGARDDRPDRAAVHRGGARTDAATTAPPPPRCSASAGRAFTPSCAATGSATSTTTSAELSAVSLARSSTVNLA